MQEVVISAETPELVAKAQSIAQTFQLTFVNFDAITSDYWLMLGTHGLQLHSKQFKPIAVDFIGGKLNYRLRHSGRWQLLSRAVGAHKEKHLVILDVTAGLGADAFILAKIGCSVKMLERSSVISALVQDGLERAYLANVINPEQLKLCNIDARKYLLEMKSQEQPDVIYLDPMFPDLKSSALVKKEMRILRDIVGEDPDADELFNLALKKAKKRVVVKRHIKAPLITEQQPDLVLKGETTRFDVYFF